MNKSAHLRKNYLQTSQNFHKNVSQFLLAKQISPDREKMRDKVPKVSISKKYYNKIIKKSVY